MGDRLRASPSSNRRCFVRGLLRSSRGQAALEVALLAPFLLFLLLILAEMGHALNAYITIVDASRDGARIASNGTASDTDIRNLIVNETDRLSGSIDPVNDITIIEGVEADGDPFIDVEVCYDHPLLLGLELTSVIPNPLRMCSHTQMPTPFGVPMPLPPTPTPTLAPTPTPAPACVASDTGFLNPSAQAADPAFGDGDGFEVNPSLAFADGGGFAENIDGEGDRHRYYNYGISIPVSSVITGIEVRLDWWLDSTSGSNSMRVELSWDGGTSWTIRQSDSTETTSEHTAVLGGPTDTWGHTWAVNELSDSNFRVRVRSRSDSSSRDFFLDWVPVRVCYEPPGGATPTLTPTPTPVPTPTPTPTPTLAPTPTPAPACVASDTGFLNPSTEADDPAFGDFDGFEVNPSFAFADGGGSAENINGADDRHRYYNYGISIPAGSVITGIEVRLDWWLTSTSGSNSMSAELSWDGGTSWTAAKTDIQETTSEHTAVLGGPTDTWGHTWTVAELSDANFQVRLTSNSDQSWMDFFLDWVPVRVCYGP